MKTLVRSCAILATIFASSLCVAQAPAGAPAGSTAICNDGTYFSGATKSGGCRGHKGIKTWWGPSGTAAATPAATTTKADKKSSSKAAPAPAPTPAPAPVAAPAPAPAPAPVKSQASAPAAKTPRSSSASKTPAPGGGPGLVWLNTSSNVYHCYGTQYYGTTKEGQYVTEDQAKAKGAHGDAGKSCK